MVGNQSGGEIFRLLGLAKLFAISPEKGGETIIYLASLAAVTETTGRRQRVMRPVRGKDDWRQSIEFCLNRRQRPVF
ncbi:MAG: hypothetical protein ACLP4V_04470 [Methylocella sp.]